MVIPVFSSVINPVLNCKKCCKDLGVIYNNA